MEHMRNYTAMPGEGKGIEDKLKIAREKAQRAGFEATSMSVEKSKKDIARMAEDMSAEEISSTIATLMRQLEKKEREDGAGHA
ncbi:MAG: hypothetical protein ACD_81C00183G0003 [uncultured bacterium]|uniref:Uncharacterized protein n=2 Tax=Candidatus Wolfeibacteriota TaxID=1752735 RepID=A0A0G1H939_9BACT|nr:MAG: hypothetical protein ACD_81C00183G0003 [uncultured bacterium]KKR12194.1 MAG: hypothetical protein UT41_C0003G0121 [Candidatus Wolfebacteria bacterium GW2011_GWC2_39_22]KKT43023.1 MAG: hypothetical protein UW32_C0003G0126 [Candidatus Wolfebacteria bacterium GW2011_GWE2_44_13]HBI25187.1 hypothetical protein [Candidatus Wolfebacteria bacterium]